MVGSGATAEKVIVRALLYKTARFQVHAEARKQKYFNKYCATVYVRGLHVLAIRGHRELNSSPAPALWLSSGKIARSFGA